jgi:phytoene desaturase
VNPQPSMGKSSAIIVGAGLGGIATACLLAKKGWRVTVVEKNSQLGGRIGRIETNGFRFDTGPSWLLMPDVFEHFFTLLGEDLSHHLNLTRLAPAFRAFFADGSCVDLQADIAHDAETFERIEQGSGSQLKKYLAMMQYQYNLAVEQFIYKNYDSRRDFNFKMLSEGIKLNVLSNFDRKVGKQFKSLRLRQILEFATLFLGTRPSETPALYGILNHALLTQGVFYPAGGIYTLIEALTNIAKTHGVVFKLHTSVQEICVESGKATGVIVDGNTQLSADIVISNADLHHTEHNLLAANARTYDNDYWEKARLAPSACIMYLGLKGTLPQLSHHNLLFSHDWESNFADVFDTQTWPEQPSLYICNPSKTDKNVAPPRHENLFVLVPVAAGIEYSTDDLEAYSKKILKLMASRLEIPDLSQRIVYKQLYCAKDFAQQFNSFQGSALGLSHIFRQTAVFRPSSQNSRVRNLYYVGASTHPGIGMPPTLISAELLAKRLDQIKRRA